MKRLNLLLLVAFIALNVLSNAQENPTIWVKLKKDDLFENGNTNPTSVYREISSLINQFDVKSIHKAVPASKKESLQNLYEIECDCNTSEFIKALNNQKQFFENPVEGPNYQTLYMPNDYSITYTNDYALDQINGVGAWAQTTGDTSVHIAISDIGFVHTHEELTGGKVKYVDPYVYPYSYHHGTAVAITAAGNTDNGQGKSAIGYDCSLEFYPMNYNGILNASNNGVKIINVSWMSGCTYNTYIQDIIDEVYDNGSIVIAAAGNGAASCNGPDSHVYPASLNHVISVTSIGPNYNHERYIGDPNSTHQHNDSVDIAAPGYDVALSLDPNSYITGNGSSFAAPLVSGTVGLMLSVNPCLSFEDVESILKTTSTNIDTINPGYAGQIGSGALNAHAAVIAAQSFSKFSPEINTSFSCETWSYKATVDANHSSPIIDQYWLNNVYDDTLTIDSSMQIYVTLIDSNNCIGVDSVFVEVPANINLLHSSSNALCFNDSSGSISNQITGGTLPYTYQWSDGAQTLNRPNISAGSYDFLVKDSNNCELTHSYVIESPSAIQTTIETSCAENNQNNGTASVWVSGGTPGYTFSWGDGNTTQNRNDLSSGVHSLIITDDNGCTINEDIEICLQTLSISDANMNDFNIYPNPFSNQVYIDNSFADMRLQVISSTGQVVFNKKIANEKSLDFSHLADGLYLFNIYDQEQLVQTKKILKN